MDTEVQANMQFIKTADKKSVIHGHGAVFMLQSTVHCHFF